MWILMNGYLSHDCHEHTYAYLIILLLIQIFIMRI